MINCNQPYFVIYNGNLDCAFGLYTRSLMEQNLSLGSVYKVASSGYYNNDVNRPCYYLSGIEPIMFPVECFEPLSLKNAFKIFYNLR